MSSGNRVVSFNDSEEEEEEEEYSEEVNKESDESEEMDEKTKSKESEESEENEESEEEREVINKFKKLETKFPNVESTVFKNDESSIFSDYEIKIKKYDFAGASKARTPTKERKDSIPNRTQDSVSKSPKRPSLKTQKMLEEKRKNLIKSESFEKRPPIMIESYKQTTVELESESQSESQSEDEEMGNKIAQPVYNDIQNNIFEKDIEIMEYKRNERLKDLERLIQINDLTEEEVLGLGEWVFFGDGAPESQLSKKWLSSNTIKPERFWAELVEENKIKPLKNGGDMSDLNTPMMAELTGIPNLDAQRVKALVTVQMKLNPHDIIEISPEVLKAIERQYEKVDNKEGTLNALSQFYDQQKRVKSK